MTSIHSAEQGVAVSNIWDANASQKGLERAADKIAAGIEKASGKNANDTANAMQKNTERVVGAVKDSAEKVSDTLKRTATNNAMDGTQAAAVSEAKPIPTGVTVVCDALRSLSTSTRRIADHLESNPTDAHAVAESAKAIGERFTDLTAAISTASESNEQLRKAAGEAQQASGWIGGNFSNSNPSVSVANNSFGAVVGSFAELLN
jgi:methyl-accepting chemotaxis protein